MHNDLSPLSATQHSPLFMHSYPKPVAFHLSVHKDFQGQLVKNQPQELFYSKVPFLKANTVDSGPVGLRGCQAWEPQDFTR